MGTHLTERLALQGWSAGKNSGNPECISLLVVLIAGGAEKFGEISSKTGLDRAHLTTYLGTLSDFGFIVREVPVTERSPEKSRKGQYVIADPFIRFWYRFVYPSFSRLEGGDVKGVVRDIIEPQLHNYVSLHVEAPLSSQLVRGCLRNHIPFQPTFGWPALVSRSGFRGTRQPNTAFIDLSQVSPF